MKILVTGGAGFIGSHLVDRLLREDHSVTVVDNFATGNAGNVDMDAKIVKCDIRDRDEFKKVAEGCDAIFHLAAQTDVRLSVENPDMDYQINFIGTKNVVEAAEANGAQIIFSSSCAVYGNCDRPATEDQDPKPLSQYAWNKLQAESILPKSAFIARLFNVYGQNGNSLVNKACDTALRNKELVVFGTGMQTRDYVHVNDVVSALMMGLERKGMFNVGNGKETSILSVIHLAELATGNKVKTKFASHIEVEIERSVADIIKIESEGWNPSVSITDGIKKLCRN